MWGGRQGELFAQMLLRHKTRYPAVVVEPLMLRTRGVHDKIESAHRSHSLPDLFVFDSSRRREMERLGCLEDLSPYAARDGLDLATLLTPRDYARCKVDGRFPAMPLVSAHGMGVLFRNLRILRGLGLPLDRRPGNWQEFTEQSRELVRLANPDGYLRVIALDPFGGVGLMPFVLLAHGDQAPVLNEGGDQSLVASKASMRSAEAIETYVEEVYGAFGGWRALLRWRHEFGGIVTSPASDPFVLGRCVFALTGAWMTGLYQGAMDGLAFDSQPIPGLRGLHGAVAAHSWCLGMNPDSPRKVEAWDLLRFVTLSMEGGGRFCLEQGRLSGVTAFNESKDYSLLYPSWGGVLGAIRLDTPFEHSVNDASLRSLLAEVPLRRVAGEPVEMIYRDIASKHQRSLEAGGAGGSR